MLDDKVEYKKRKTIAVPFSNGTLLHIMTCNETFAKMWFSDKNENKISIPKNTAVYVTKTGEALLKPFMGFYFITWSSDYVIKKNNKPFITIKSNMLQNIEIIGTNAREHLGSRTNVS